MKKTFAAFFTLALFCAFQVPVSFSATEIESEGTMFRKAQRGFLNVALSPIEISNQLSRSQAEREDALPPNWFAGLGRGAAFAMGRALVGVYEIVTFAIPYPANYQPVLQPEFAWQHLPSSEKS